MDRKIIVRCDGGEPFLYEDVKDTTYCKWCDCTCSDRLEECEEDKRAYEHCDS